MAFKLPSLSTRTAEKRNRKRISLKIKHRQAFISSRFKMKIVIDFYQISDGEDEEEQFTKGLKTGFDLLKRKKKSLIEKFEEDKKKLKL